MTEILNYNLRNGKGIIPSLEGSAGSDVGGGGGGGGTCRIEYPPAGYRITVCPFFMCFTTVPFDKHNLDDSTPHTLA